jgi:hypothetical protein
VWTTFGGWRTYQNGQRDAGAEVAGQPASSNKPLQVPNRSEVVGYDPSTGNFCTYLVPGNDYQVAGVAAAGSSSNTQIWFVESKGPHDEGSLDEFDPASVGGGCHGRTNQAFTLPSSVRRLSWPTTGAQWPVQIAVDPSSPTLWVTNFNPTTIKHVAYSGIDEIDVANPASPQFVHRFIYPTTNSASFFGGKPWDIVAPADSDYVYAADNGDAEVVRINKATGQLQEAPVPQTSDLENLFGLSVSDGRLYFALADDFLIKFGAASTFGYIDLDSWPANGLPTQGVVYTGLKVSNRKRLPDYRAIAVGPTGQVALTDS